MHGHFCRKLYFFKSWNLSQLFTETLAVCLKNSVTRFSTLFFHQSIPPIGPWFTGESRFTYCFVFVEISTVSLRPRNPIPRCSWNCEMRSHGLSHWNSSFWSHGFNNTTESALEVSLRLWNILQKSLCRIPRYHWHRRKRSRGFTDPTISLRPCIVTPLYSSPFDVLTL
jgi:hypothetical protein